MLKVKQVLLIYLVSDGVKICLYAERLAGTDHRTKEQDLVLKVELYNPLEKRGEHKEADINCIS